MRHFSMLRHHGQQLSTDEMVDKLRAGGMSTCDGPLRQDGMRDTIIDRVVGITLPGCTMNVLSQRRGFLRGTVSLPLIGGGVTLIGNPTAAAVPVTMTLLERSKTWPFFEGQFLGREMDNMAVLHGPEAEVGRAQMALFRSILLRVEPGQYRQSGRLSDWAARSSRLPGAPWQEDRR